MTAQPGPMDYVEMSLWLGWAVFLRWVFVKQRAEFDRRNVRIVGEFVTLTLIAGGVLLLVAMATGHTEPNP